MVAHPITRFAAVSAIVTAATCGASWVVAAQQHPRIGSEAAVRTHLRDGQEFTMPLPALLAHGQLLFDANWTEQDGGGRPLTKGTGRPLSDPSQPLTGARAFNRLSAVSTVGSKGAPTSRARCTLVGLPWSAVHAFSPLPLEQ